MFDPQAPIIFKPPVTKKEQLPMTGIGSLVGLFETTPAPKPKPFEAPAERKKKTRERMQKLHKEKNDLLAQDWDPHHNSKATSNPYTTLFVGRLSYDVTDKKLRREFETYGPIRSVQVVTDSDGKSRGYAFIEFENENDMTSAVRKAEGRKIDGRRIVCDVERGRYRNLVLLTCVTCFVLNFISCPQNCKELASCSFRRRVGRPRGEEEQVRFGR